MVMVRRPIYSQSTVYSHNNRAASVPTDFSNCMAPDSALGAKVHCIATHASHAADDIASSSRKHDIQFLHDVNRKMISTGRPPSATPAPRRNVSVPATYHSKRSTWVAPSTTRHTDDYEVAAFLSGGPLRPYTPLRSASLAPAGHAGRQTISAYTTGHRPSYRWDNDSDDVVVGMARTSRYGDFAVPSHKQHQSYESSPPHIPFVATRIVPPYKGSHTAYSSPDTRITHHRSISLPIQVSAPTYAAYASDYSPAYASHVSDFTAGSHASAYTPAPLMAQLAAYPEAYALPYPVHHQYPVHQHHQIDNVYVPSCDYQYAGAYTSPYNKNAAVYATPYTSKAGSYTLPRRKSRMSWSVNDYEDEEPVISRPVRSSYGSSLPPLIGGSGGYRSVTKSTHEGPAGDSGTASTRSLTRHGQDRTPALDRYMPTPIKRSESVPYVPPVVNYKNVKAPMSDTRKNIRDLLCKTRKDPHYFD